MSLQIKFLLLIGTLLLGVVGSIAASAYSLRLVHREVATPFEQMSVALAELGRTKRAIERAAAIMGGGERAVGGVRELGNSTELPRAQGGDGAAVIEATRKAIEHVERLQGNEWYLSRIGVPTWSNIRQRLREFSLSAEAWTQGSDDYRRDVSRHAAFELHELIERTELRLLDDANETVRFSDRLTRTTAWWLAAVILAATLTSILAVVLLRRWVQSPVGELRRAAARIAAGDFAHRVTVQTDDEIGQLMAEVNHMATMVDQYQREAIERERLAAIGQMVRRIVHNVRNPLAGIRGLAEVSRLDAPADSEQRENLTLILSTVDTFERWLTQLLETTKPLDLQPVRVEVEPWVRGVVHAHEAGARAKNVRLDVREHGPIGHAVFDPRHMEHALAAIVANAIDASPPGQTVTVHLSTTKDDQVEILVCDNGPGVPEPLRERIFEAHFTTKAQGTGIGLAIARQILLSHGGTLVLKPAGLPGIEADGACFSLVLPRGSDGAV